MATDASPSLGGDVQRDRLSEDSRKWLASKIEAEVYGDRLQQQDTGNDGGPVQVEMSDEGAARRLLFVFNKLQHDRNEGRLKAS